MATAAISPSRLPVVHTFVTNFVIALIALFVGWPAIRYLGTSDSLHTVLDTSVVLAAGLTALLYWDISRRTDQTTPLLFAISFAMLAVGELAHVLGVLGWLGEGPVTDVRLRSGTWGPPALLLPVGLLAALALRPLDRSVAWLFTLGMVLLALVFVAIFLSVPRYTEPDLFGISRPSLILIPLLWAVLAVRAWRVRSTSENAIAFGTPAVIFLAAHSIMLYSRAPDDAAAMAAHFGKMVAELLLLFNMIQIGLADTARRQHVEQELKALNRELDARVTERTARMQESNERLRLLEQITRAIGQRQDVHSIFQIAVRTLEDQLPADFVCICRYDRVSQKLNVAHVGVRSAALGQQLGIIDRAEIEIDQNGLSRCVAGELVYEPDIAQIDFPFPSRLAAEGLRSLVVAPLMIEGEVFGVLLVSRLQDNAFASTDSEFLRQLGEHIALAAYQADLRTNLQQAYDDLRRSQQAVLEQERLRAIGQMASGIAHDINNAISPVSLYTQSLLEREPDISSEVRDYVGLVGRVVNDVAATVGRMRDFYRNRDEDDELTPINLNELVPQLVDLTRARWSDMPQQQGVVIKVSTEFDADLPPIMGNASELREAVTNLIFNAVDAMPQGGTIVIRTETFPGGSDNGVRVRLEVADTGVGMDEETRKRCLDPFFTTKGERGTGLGLAMVYGAAQRHKAGVNIDSAPGEGTRIGLEFAAAKTTGRGREVAPALKHRPLRLLLVDDDPAVLHSTAFVLKRDGHAITAADGGQAAIDTLQSALAAGESFDAVITDLGMPYVDGNQVAREVKELFPSTPVVLVTGWGRRMANGDDAPAHVDFMLPKPLELNELRAIFVQMG